MCDKMCKTSVTRNRQILVIYLINIFIIIMANMINAKNIIYGKPIIDLNGNLKVPVFVPISWLIHDIHSAKLIGHKSDVNDMMTSDMTPDANGNFGTQNDVNNAIRGQTKNERPNANTANKIINNRVSDTKAVAVIAATEQPKQWNGSRRPEYSSEAIKSDRDNIIDNSQMKIGLESVQEKLIAQKGLTDEIMYEPDVWPKDMDPLFTTIEVYEIPGANKLIGLESNRTAVHSAPPKPPNMRTVRLQMAVDNKTANVQLSQDSRKDPYFKNYVNKIKNA